MKPHIKFGKLYRAYVCRLRGRFNGYGDTPLEAFRDWSQRNFG